MSSSGSSHLPSGAQHELCHAVFNSAPIPMVIVDGQGILQQANAAAVKLGGKGDIRGLRIGEGLGCPRHSESAQGCGKAEVCRDCSLWDSIRHTVETGESRDAIETGMYLGKAPHSALHRLVLSTTLLGAPECPLVLVCLEDVTSSRQTQEALRKSNDKFSSVFYLSPDAIGISRVADGVFLDINEGFSKMTGFSRADALGRTSLAGGLNLWINPAQRERLIASLKATGEIIALEAEFRCKDGSTITGMLSARLIVLDGEPCVLAIIRDVTAGKKVEAALVESEQRLILAQRAGQVGVFDWNIPAGVSFQTAELEALHGMAPGAQGSPDPNIVEWARLIYPPDRPAVREKIIHCFQEHRNDFEHEFRIVRPDGTLRWLNTRARISYDAAGNPLRMIGTSVDMTDRKMAEDAVLAHQRRLATAMELAHLAYWDCDLASSMFTFNDQFYTLYGTTAQREGGYTMSIEDYTRNFIHPDDIHLMGEEVAKTLASTDPHYVAQVEHRMIRRDGAVRHIAVRAGAIKDADGRTVRTHGINLDITDRVVLEEQLRQAQKMEAIGRLAGGIAHDFRNHLTVIKGFGELLRENQDVRPQGLRLLDEILKAAAQSAQLTEQLLLFSRKQNLQPKRVDIGDLTEEICGILPRLVGDDIRIRFSREGGPFSVQLDPVQFHQALFNLAANARDAMPQGGTLTLHCFSLIPDASFLERHPNKVGRLVGLQVSDTGCGIDAPALSRLFEPFFTTKDPGKGTGLGLASVYGFVNQSGGLVEVQSRPGAGTTFFLYFPAADPADPQVTATESPAEYPGGSERILVVEDDDAVRNLVRRFLEPAGYHVLLARNADEALAVLGNLAEPLHLMVTDLTMPGLSGAGLVVRAREIRSDLAIVLMSAHAESELMRRGIHEAQGHFLAKPFSRRELLHLVRQALDDRP